MFTMPLAIVTMLSLLLAAVTSALAWRMRRDERRRTAARVAVLAAAIHAPSQTETAVQPVASGAQAKLFVEPVAGAWGRLTVAAMAGALAVAAIGTVTGLVLLAESGSRTARRGADATGAQRRADVPLELITLEHDRDGNGLVVRGIVRNPAPAITLNGLRAVVLAFSKDGEFVASGRAAVATSTLSPGAETAFVVTIPDADAVDRYRVSFRTDDRIVPHVDRRNRITPGQPE
jgi:hypothetical protein